MSSIYGSDFKTESEASRSYTITIEDGKLLIQLHVTMPEDYPSLSPPKYEISAPWMDRNKKGKLYSVLDETYLWVVAIISN